MKNRQKPNSTRSYAGTGGDHIRKSESTKDGIRDLPTAEEVADLVDESSKELERQVAEQEAELAKALAENEAMRQEITVLKKEQRGKAKVVKKKEDANESTDD